MTGIRLSDNELQVGTLRTVKEGQPFNGDLVRLKHREGGVFDVEDLYSTRSGPAQVNSEAFRSGWDRTFGSSKTLN